MLRTSQNVRKFVCNLGKTIAQIRRGLPSHMSQGELAKKAGITQGYLSEVEAGKRRLSFPVLVQICQGLDMAVSELVIKTTLCDRPLSGYERDQVELACAIIAHQNR